MTGIDTNCLIAMSAVEHPFHERCQELLRREILNPGAEIALTPAVLAEFIHVMTDARRLKRPFTMEQACDHAQDWWTAAQVIQVHPTAESVALFFSWMRHFHLGRKRVLDTLLAATLHTAGARRLMTANPDDFRVFGVFELLVP